MSPGNFSTDIITDFTDVQDRLGLQNGITFAALIFTQGTAENANNTLIQVANTGEVLAILSGVSVNTINSTDFISI